MIWALVSLPVVLLAIAAAILPVLHTMLRDERRRTEARAVAARYETIAAPLENESDSGLAA